MSSLPGSLRKEKRWDPDSLREASWRRRKRNYNYGLLKRSQSFTNDDVNELEACFELGFGFDDSDDLDPKLTDAFPALEFYNAVVKNNSNCLSRSPSSVTVGSDIDSDSLVGSPASNSSNSLFTPGITFT